MVIENVTDEQAEEALKAMLGGGEAQAGEDIQIKEEEVVTPKEEVIEPKKSEEPVEKQSEEGGDDAGKSDKKGNPEKRFQKILRQKNEAQAKVKEYKEKLDKLEAGDYTEEEYASARDADRAVVRTEAEKTYSERRADELDVDMKDSFFEETPGADKYKDGILEIMTQNPNLAIDQAHKLYLATNHPDQLYDKHKIRQKSNNGMIGTGGDGKGTQQKPNLDKVGQMSPAQIAKLSTADMKTYLDGAKAQGITLI